MPGIVGAKARHLAMGLGAVLVWSACFVVIDASRGDAPPRLYAGLGALLGGLPLLALAANRGVARFHSPAGRGADCEASCDARVSTRGGPVNDQCRRSARQEARR